MKRKKYLIITLILFLLIIASNFSSANIYKSIFKKSNNNNIYRNVQDNKDDFLFYPMDITLKDDAYHGTRSFHSYEWWYFDATLDNGYCVQLSIQVLNILNPVLYTIALNIYQDGEPISNNQEVYFKDKIYTSTTEPLVILEGKEIMRGYTDEENGDWIYDVDLVMNNVAIDLTFVGDTKGWKGSTPGIGWWGVILPHARVTGNISFNDFILDAKGYGYHDHNWEITFTAGVNFGWYWGKIHSSSYTITWADVKITRFSENPFVVINKKNGDYIHVPSEAIQLKPMDLIFFNGKLIPDSFELTINYEDIYANVYIGVYDIHHIRKFGIINYWRYHVNCNGFIRIGDISEEINEDNIAEFLRFR